MKFDLSCVDESLVVNFRESVEKDNVSFAERNI